MKIELENRGYWREACENLLSSYKFIRDYSDAHYENEWRNEYLKTKDSLWRYVTGKTTEFPTHGNMDLGHIYPSCTGSYWTNKIEILLKSISDGNTGSIFIDGDLYEVLQRYAPVKKKDIK